MPEKREHLKFDLSILDRVSSPEPQGEVSSTAYKYNWRNIGVIGLITIVVGVLIFSGNSSKPSGSYTPTSYSSPATDNGPNDWTSSDQVSVGRYRCSSARSAQADSLKPRESTEEMEAAGADLDSRANELKLLKSTIELSETTPSSSQADVDAYNEKVEEYNSKLNALKYDSEAYETRKRNFNEAVEAYNQYLQNNCQTRP